MTEDGISDAGDRLSLRDVAAFVAGTAVAAVHVRGVTEGGPLGPGWPLVWAAFAGLAVTAAGPFVYAGRRWSGGPMTCAGVGERLWGILGLPWLAAAVFQNGPVARNAAADGRLAAVVCAGVGLTSLIALVVTMATWVLVSPERASETFRRPWTNRVGLVLAIAWPVQCGLGLMVIG